MYSLHYKYLFIISTSLIILHKVYLKQYILIYSIYSNLLLVLYSLVNIILSCQVMTPKKPTSTSKPSLTLSTKRNKIRRSYFDYKPL